MTWHHHHVFAKGRGADLLGKSTDVIIHAHTFRDPEHVHHPRREQSPIGPPCDDCPTQMPLVGDVGTLL